ncbi:MAG: T9SS type A sorting domain-containing protein [Bacteroidota bacterium]
MNSLLHGATLPKVKLMMVFVSALMILLSAGREASAAPDTTWSVTFSVNMSKAVKEHTFNAATDSVFVVLSPGIAPLKLVEGAGYVYSGTLYNEIDSTTTYTYYFRKNGSTPEAITRQFIPKPGMSTIAVWWNNDPLNITTFVANMQYAAQNQLFNPATDSVSVVGTMNNMKGSPKMTRIGTSLNYSYYYTLAPGSVVEYKYRINRGDTAKGQAELVNQPNRLILIPDTLLEVTDDYNNVNPSKLLMTFRCNMAYYVKSHRFSISADYLDIAGSFNNGGAHDVLFRLDTDTVYTLRKFLDTTYIHQAPITFKFRINGSWSSAELTGKPNRTYTLHDTTGVHPNIFSCYYNNLDPTIPTRPWAYNLGIQGTLIHKQILSGIYTYEDVNGIPEDSTTYRWLRSTDAAGINAVAIDSARKITYTVDTLDMGKYLVFEVTPRAAKGDSAVGIPVRFVSGAVVYGVGIDEHQALITRVYPNPVTDLLTVETSSDVTTVELINLAGQRVMTARGFLTRLIRLSPGHLPKGIYLLKATAKSGDFGVIQVVKN